MPAEDFAVLPPGIGAGMAQEAPGYSQPLEAQPAEQAQAQAPLPDGGAAPADPPVVPAPATPAADAAPLFEVGQLLRRWRITSRIGGGAFGETYAADDEGDDVPLEARSVCIKAEKQDKRMVLRSEVLALKRAQTCPFVVRYVASGRQSSVNYMVMERLGDNLADVRRRCNRGIMDLYSALRYAISCIDAIEGTHRCGLVHRDIKPSNFVLGKDNNNGADPETDPDTAFRTYLIDFGLAKRYCSSDGTIKPPRENAGFRGTSRYASLCSHRQQDLGRVDDLWSLLFMTVEFITGTLPWRKAKEKDAIGAIKEETVGPQLVRYLPREFTAFISHLMALGFHDEPNYEMLRGLLWRTIERKGCGPKPRADPTPEETKPPPPPVDENKEDERGRSPRRADQPPAKRPVMIDGQSRDVVINLQGAPNRPSSSSGSAPRQEDAGDDANKDKVPIAETPPLPPGSRNSRPPMSPTEDSGVNIGINRLSNDVLACETPNVESHRAAHLGAPSPDMIPSTPTPAPFQMAPAPEEDDPEEEGPESPGQAPVEVAAPSPRDEAEDYSDAGEQPEGREVAVAPVGDGAAVAHGDDAAVIDPDARRSSKGKDGKAAKRRKSKKGKDGTDEVDGAKCGCGCVVQ